MKTLIRNDMHFILFDQREIVIGKNGWAKGILIDGNRLPSISCLDSPLSLCHER